MTPTTGSNSIRMPVRVPPMRRIAVRNSSDDSPAATTPARSTIGHGDRDRNGASSPSPWPAMTARIAPPTMEPPRIISVAASARTVR